MRRQWFRYLRLWDLLFIFSITSSGIAIVSPVHLLHLHHSVCCCPDEKTRAGLDLGRRGKVVVEGLENDGIGEGVKKVQETIGLDDPGLDTPGLGIFDAFVASFSMLLVSEIGDETFIIAALMAMRHPKSIVLSGALSSLIVMTGYAIPKEEQEKVAKFSFHGQPAELKHGSVVIAAITSCTNTSNPSVMLGAGLVAKKPVNLV